MENSRSLDADRKTGTIGHRLIVYDKDANILWEGSFSSPVPIFHVGAAFWIGSFSNRHWYEIEKTETGLDAEANALTTEVWAVAQRHGGPSKDKANLGDEHQKRKKQPENYALAEDARNFVVNKGKEVRWKNKKGNVLLIFCLTNDRLSVELFEETSSGPNYEQINIMYPDRGSGTRLSTTTGYIRVIIEDGVNNSSKFDLRIMEFESAEKQ